MQFSVASLFATVALLFGATQVAAIAADPCEPCILFSFPFPFSFPIPFSPLSYCPFALFSLVLLFSSSTVCTVLTPYR